jgi:thiamine transport system permease protein
MGGGPRATTIELAIYQAVRFDFDLGKAALLACIQFGLCVGAAMLALRVTAEDLTGAGMDRVVQRWDFGRAGVDYAWIIAAALFLLVPLGMVVLRGLPGLLDLPDTIWAAALRSMIVAIGSAILCAAMALALALRGGAVIAIVGVLPLAASGLVVGRRSATFYVRLLQIYRAQWPSTEPKAQRSVHMQSNVSLMAYLVCVGGQLKIIIAQ